MAPAKAQKGGPAHRRLRVVEPAPLPTSHARTGNLPQAAAPIVGRESQIADVGRLVETSPLVTLTGPSGIGKTRLAVEVAARLQADYPGGAWLVELAPVADAALVAQAVASALGLDPEPGRDPVDAIVAHLGRSSCLLVLDNCEHVLDRAAAVARRLLEDCRWLRILATSQQALAVSGERLTAVGPLTLPASATGTSVEEALEGESVALFCARAARAAPGFTLTEEVLAPVAEICTRLDGIPLAIELAAARIASLGPADIADRLEQRFRLLTRGGPIAEARHQTLRAALDWSYGLLSEEEALLFRRMAVFAGGATLHAVEEVCGGKGVPRDEVVDLVGSLVSKSLVIADTQRARARYRLLETIRAYGRDRLDEEEETAFVRNRHAAWCVARAERAWHQITGGDGQPWTRDLDAELDNMRAALDWTVSTRSPAGLRLASALTPYWQSRGYFREGQEWLTRVLATGAGGPHRARALWGLGLLAIMRGDVGAARPAVEESLALAREGRFRRAEAEALTLLAFISIFTQDPQAAIPLLEESVALARMHGDSTSLAGALAYYGRAHLFLGDVDAARKVFDECLNVAEHGGDSPVRALIGLGWTATAAGELSQAQHLFARALPILRDLGERFETALVLSFLGELAWARGELVQARALLGEGRDLARVMGGPFPLSRSLCGLARVAQAEGDSDAAAAAASEACAVAGEARLPYALVRALQVRGDQHRATGHLDAARADYDDSLVLARTNGDAGGEAAALYRSGLLARDRGADDEATGKLLEALSLQIENGDGGLVDSLEALAGVALVQNRTIHAAGLFGAAAGLRERSGSVVPPDTRSRHEADVADLRGRLDAGPLEAAWAQGAAMSRAEAAALAARGRGSRSRSLHGWGSLSPTEIQIVDLVADGLTNREIGEHLFISPRTVQGYLSRIFSKIGVSSRRDLREARRQK